jgi:hypothetical protein
MEKSISSPDFCAFHKIWSLSQRAVGGPEYRPYPSVNGLSFKYATVRETVSVNKNGIKKNSSLKLFIFRINNTIQSHLLYFFC